MDTSKINGYETMTAEEKVAALESYNVPAPDYSGYVKKEQFDKAASEASEWKKKHNALLSEDERKKAESDEELTKMREELASMKRDKLISEHKAEFISIGYDDELATESAESFANGEITKVFANMKRFLENHDKALKAELMKSTPTPPAGVGNDSGLDYDRAISDAQSRGDMVSAAAFLRKKQETLNLSK